MKEKGNKKMPIIPRQEVIHIFLFYFISSSLHYSKSVAINLLYHQYPQKTTSYISEKTKM